MVYGMCWKAGLYKHALDAPINHYLEKIDILSFLCIHIKQGM